MVGGSHGVSIQDQAQQPERMLEAQFPPQTDTLLHETVVRLGVEQAGQFPHGLLAAELGSNRGPHLALPAPLRLPHRLQPAPIERQGNPVAHLETSGPQRVDECPVGVGVIDPGEYPRYPAAEHEIGGIVIQYGAQVGHALNTVGRQGADGGTQPPVACEQRHQVGEVLLRPCPRTAKGPIDEDGVA